MKKLSLAGSSAESTFKGNKNAWPDIIGECEEANYLFLKNNYYVDSWFDGEALDKWKDQAKTIKAVLR